MAITEDQRLKLALNAALNQSALASSNFRQAMMRGAGSDDKRKCAWQEYGWKENLGFDDFYKLYDRQGVAYGVIKLLNDKCYETDPWVIEGDETEEKEAETPWEKKFRSFAKKSKLWKAFQVADEYRLVGRYAGLILRIADGGNWDTQVSGARPVIREIIPAWEGQLTPVDFVTDPNREDYGQPTYWQYAEGDVNTGDVDNVVQPRNLKIHPSRIIILGDWRAGRSFLRAGYNAFVNLEKIEGGSAESFLKNAGRQMHVNYDKDVNLAQIARDYGLKDVAELQAVFNQEARDLNNGSDRLMITQGATANALVSTVPDPAPHYGISVQTVAASTQLPAKVIVGMQTGERASTEDLKQVNKRAQGRRLHDLRPDGEAIVEHLIGIGLVEPTEEFTLMWDDLTEATQAEKLDNAIKMADINQKSAGNGDVAVFASTEIREVAGFENDKKSKKARAADGVLPDGPADADIEPVQVPA
jgi:hypothetical protein